MTSSGVIIVNFEDISHLVNFEQVFAGCASLQTVLISHDTKMNYFTTFSKKI